MPLSAGTKLGPYEIVAPLGAGGMGEVYRARDARLGRDVAIKVLPEHLSSHPEVRARFEREARTISTLNHPNICTLFDVGREPGVGGAGETDYLVMELIEGETLAERLKRGALPANELLRIGAQIADALDRAHRAGVVHRDLKPGNIMLTRAGAKLMDFGLARTTTAAGPVSGSGATMAMLTHAPTVASPLTAEGAIVGTFQYMSPEQLEGRESDARSDIWALGCVLYEMATGQRPFGGGSQASLISSIMKEEPRPIVELVPLAPVALARVVRECLAKDPERRLQSAHDIKLQLEWIAEPGSQSGVSAPVAARPRRPAWLAQGAALLVVAAVALAAGRLWPRGATQNSAVRSVIPAPAGVDYASTDARPMSLALSPDGRTMVFCAHAGEGRDMLYVRALDSDESRALAGTEDASSPFFSPDGRSVAFFSRNALRRVDISGGPVTLLAPASDPRGGTWNARGDIVFAADGTSGLSRVAADGGKVTVATELDTVAHEGTHRYPYFLPDGKHFLYLARKSAAGPGSEPMLYVGELGSKRRSRVLEIPSNAAYANGQLFFVRGGALQAQPFDAHALKLTGAARTFVENVRWNSRFTRAVFAVSSNGVLVCMTGEGSTHQQLAWVDRRGQLLRRIGEPLPFTYGGYPILSPDGRSALAVLLNPDRGNSDVHLVDLESGRTTRLTVGGRDYAGAAWGRDSRHFYATSALERGYGIERRSLASPEVELLVRRDVWVWPADESPDGRFLLFTDDDGRSPGAPYSLLPLPAGEPRPVHLSLETIDSGSMPEISPDGALLALASDESGRPEIYVTPFPDCVQRWQITNGGGSAPHWSHDGRRLYYLDPDNQLTCVELQRGPQGVQIGVLTRLFQIHANAIAGASYAVAPDEQRFLVLMKPASEVTPPVTLITNWPALLQQR